MFGEGELFLTSGLSECEYFHKQKWFRLTCTVCSSITSRKLHLKSSRPSNSCKSLTQYCSNTSDASYQPGSIQQTVHYSIITPVPLFIANIVWSIENPLRRSNLQKNRELSRIFSALQCAKYRSIRLSIDGRTFEFEGEDRLMVMTTDQLLWRQKTYFRGVVPWQATLLSRCFSPPRCSNGHWFI